MSMRGVVGVRVPVRRMPPRRAGINFPLEILHARPVLLDDFFDVADPVKVHLELIQLADNLRIAGNLFIRPVNDVPSTVVLDLGKDLCLLAEVLDVLLNVGHQAVEVASKLGQRRAVKHQEALTASPAGSSRTVGSSI